MTSACKSTKLDVLMRPVLPYLGTAAAFSLAINLLFLAGPLYMLQVYDRVVSGSGTHALFDLPWAPIYIGIIFMLHWSLGAFALACGLVLVAMALINEWLVGSPLGRANAAAARNYGFTEMSLRNTEAIRA